MSASSPPEDPEYTSEPAILSPVSPKPIHFPTPDSIPVLHNQIDLTFNQMATHIGGQAQSQNQVHEQEGTHPSTGAQGASNDEASNAQLQAAMTDTPHGLNVSSDPQVNVTADPSVRAETAPSQTQDLAMSELSAMNAPIQTSDVAHTALPSATQDSLHDQVAPPQSNGATSDHGTGPSNVPDYSAILNSLKSSHPAASTLDPAASYVPLQEKLSTPSQALSTEYNAAFAGLPPRPPPQAQPPTNQTFAPGSDSRQYYPQGASTAAQALPQPLFPTGASGLPPPPLASFQQPPIAQVANNPPASPAQGTSNGGSGHSREGRNSMSDIVFDGEPKWDAGTQKEFDHFLDQERQYVTAGNWESFPMGSRLFVGNLSSERVTKRDVFHVFHQYGKLAQISIKQAYGFVQFLNADDCLRALQAEQGSVIRGKRINLEISKPQRNKAGVGTGGAGAGRRRSRSPDRGVVDRHVTGSRQSDHRPRGRDDYRPGRNHSPPRGGRDSYGRYRSRSRTPPGRGRYRSPSPRRNEDDDLPLPRRTPRDVPDLQIIIIDNIDRDWIQWLERTIGSRGVKVDVLMLSPKLSETAVIKRQIIEGVTAVSRVNRFCRQTNKIPLQVFDRRGGAEVRFEEYADLDPQIAAEVVNRAKINNAPAPPPSYGYGYSSAAPALPSQPSLPPNLGNAIGSMDASALQKLLGAMQPGQPALQSPQMTPDLAKLLGSAVADSQGGHYGQQSQDPLAALRSNPAFASLLGQSAPAQQQQQTPQHMQQSPQGGGTNMADILAKLGSYKR